MNEPVAFAAGSLEVVVMGQAREEVTELTRELLDLECRRPLTPRLLRWANLSCLGAAAYGVVWLVTWAFQQSLWVGLVHLLLVAPLALGAALVVTRLVLEAGLALHDIRSHVMELGELPRKVSSWPAMQKLAALGERNGWTASRTQAREQGAQGSRLP